VTPHGNGLTALWRVPFDHLTRYAVHDFRSFSRLFGGPYRSLSFDKLISIVAQFSINFCAKPPL
jgi:hypothetical protein